MIRASRNPVSQRTRQRTTLAVRERADLLVLRQAHREQHAPASCPAPAALTHKKIAQRHALCLPRAVEYDVGDRCRLCCNAALELGPCEPDLVRLLERAQVLWRSLRRGAFGHDPPRGDGLTTTPADPRHEARSHKSRPLSLGPPSESVGVSRCWRTLSARALELQLKLTRRFAKSGVFFRASPCSDLDNLKVAQRR